MPKRLQRSRLPRSFITGAPRIMPPPWKWRYTAVAGSSGRNSRHGTPAISRSTASGTGAYICANCERASSARSTGSVGISRVAPIISLMTSKPELTASRASARIASMSSVQSCMTRLLSRPRSIAARGYVRGGHGCAPPESPRSSLRVWTSRSRPAPRSSASSCMSSSTRRSIRRRRRTTSRSASRAIRTSTRR